MPQDLTFTDDDGRHWALRPEGTPGSSGLYDYETGERVGTIRAQPRPHGGMTLWAALEGSPLEAPFTKPADAVRHLVARAER
jgi:hypothetical protein